MILSWTAQKNDCENNIKSINWLNQQLINRDLSTKQAKTSDSFESGQIAIKRATYLRTIGSQQTLLRNNWPNTRTSMSTGKSQRSKSEARGLELARGQEPTAEALMIQEV